VGEGAAFFEVDLSGAEEDAGDGAVTCRLVGGDVAARIQCRYVLDASGQNGVLGRQLGLRVFDDGFRFMSVWGYFDDSKYIAADGTIYSAQSVRDKPPTTYVSALPQGDGWAWPCHIRRPQTTSMGRVLPIPWPHETQGPGA